MSVENASKWLEERWNVGNFPAQKFSTFLIEVAERKFEVIKNSFEHFLLLRNFAISLCNLKMAKTASIKIYIN